MLANLAGIFILYHYKSPLLYWPYPMSNKPRKKEEETNKEMPSGSGFICF
ncbi:hypothetical protein IC627_16925 [Photobacterium damselae subsp. piscicida]|uniref:Uncharacterized protein n=1 Tax=Photobacterium damsela subsp. piscicida TaxID=38294 RepID=A0A7L8A9A0_PHODP|nr:hypothetical protein [Photobacterium damselae]QOD58522.1 hypothetical protein IC627_16925 [Photobacterium damselae subsp. piscicida]